MTMLRVGVYNAYEWGNDIRVLFVTSTNYKFLCDGPLISLQVDSNIATARLHYKFIDTATAIRYFRESLILHYLCYLQGH